MLEYIYDQNDSSIRIQKDYSINLIKTFGGVKLSIKENPFHLSELSQIEKYSIKGMIKSDDVNKQLSNIKHIGFEVTDSCNLQCFYCTYGCFYNNYDYRGNRKINFEQAKLLIDYLIKKTNTSANESFVNNIYVSFYGGEPLLNMDFIKKMVYYTQSCENDNLIFHYMMTTNAIYLKKYVSFLSDNKFIITVSLDGSKENDGYRRFPNGETSFDIVYKNLKYVQRKYPSYFKNNIGFNAVIHNLNNLQEVFSFFYYNFGKIPLFSGLTPVGLRPEKEEDFKKMNVIKPNNTNEKLEIKIKEVLGLEYGNLKELQYFIFLYSGNKFDNYNDLLVNKNDVEHIPSGTCFPFSKRIFMTVNNKIFPCERIGHQFALGKVTKKNVEINCEEIAQKYNTYYSSLQEQCTDCYNKIHCTQCMFSIDNLSEKPKCKERADKKMFDKYLKTNLNILHNQPELYRRMMTEILVAK